MEKMPWKCSEGQKNKSDGKRVERRTVQTQDKFMRSLWEESHGQHSVVHEMWKLGSWQMCKNSFDNAFCLIEM